VFAGEPVRSIIFNSGQAIGIVHAMVAEKTRFYGLLYIDEQNNKYHSNRGCGVNPIDIYIMCASLCSKSFRATGAEFHIITNNKAYISRRLEHLNLENLAVFEHNFSLIVPKKIWFYSAHFKLDIFKAFGRGQFGDHIGLIDLDTVLLRKLPRSAGLAVYDTSDQVFPAFGKPRVVSDLQLVSGRCLADPRWYGGEFVAGSAAEFSTISHYIDLCWPNYIKNIGSLHHVGDEMVMSSALNMARADSAQIVDYGQAGLVARWWTDRTEHDQAPFDAVTGVALLHLPADKMFLAREARYQFDSEALLSRFQRYARKKIACRVVADAADTLLRRPRVLFTPRLTSR
jgi:hypothetical protein